MQKLFGFLAVWCAQILFIEILDALVIVGFSALSMIIFFVETLGASKTNPVCATIGLTAAAHAAPGASHYFHEVIGRFFACYFSSADFVH